MYRNLRVVKHEDSQEMYSYRGESYLPEWNETVLHKWKNQQNNRFVVLSFDNFTFDRESFYVTDKGELERDTSCEVLEYWYFTISINNEQHKVRIEHVSDYCGGYFSVQFLVNNEWDYDAFLIESEMIYKFFSEEGIEELINDNLSVDDLRKLSTKEIMS